jgi:hypothetical protein
LISLVLSEHALAFETACFEAVPALAGTAAMAASASIAANASPILVPTFINTSIIVPR